MTPKKIAKKSVPSRPLAGLDRRYDTDPDASIDAGVLETFPYEYPGEEEVIRIDTNEFTAVCPYSGLPDFGTIRIEYLPLRSIVELRSLKYYLFSYRNVGIYQEHVVNRVLRDLVRCCNPAWMRVDVDYNIRGGVHTTVFREWGAKGKAAKRSR
jgi:7-cyano-7-deazaguanine reductase